LNDWASWLAADKDGSGWAIGFQGFVSKAQTANYQYICFISFYPLPSLSIR
jgi:hypothetical protein